MYNVSRVEIVDESGQEYNLVREKVFWRVENNENENLGYLFCFATQIQNIKPASLSSIPHKRITPIRECLTELIEKNLVSIASKNILKKTTSPKKLFKTYMISFPSARNVALIYEKTKCHPFITPKNIFEEYISISAPIQKVISVDFRFFLL